MKSVFAAALVCAAVPLAAMGQSIATAPSNNGSGGVFLDLTPTGDPLSLTSFEVPFTGTSGTAVDVEVWVRSGSYVGFTGSNAGWTLHETISGTRQGSTTNSPFVFTNPLLIPGGTSGLLFHCITTGGGIRYTGTGTNPPQTTWVNADVTLYSEHARTGAIPFGSVLSPRTFSGVINYTIVPAPGAMALLGVGGLLAARRRR